MGGIGSGQYYRWNKKTKLDDCRFISVVNLRKWGVLNNVYSSGEINWTDRQTREVKSRIGYEADFRSPEKPFLRLKYRFTDTNESIDYKIWFSASVPHYGGKRYWFICPYTKKRVNKLYLPFGAKYFASRHAYDLSYESQSEDYKFRAIRKKWKIWDKLGGDDVCPIKPKGMHEKTFQKLLNKAFQQDALCENLLYAEMQKCGVFLAAH